MLFEQCIRAAYDVLPGSGQLVVSENDLNASLTMEELDVHFDFHRNLPLESYVTETLRLPCMTVFGTRNDDMYWFDLFVHAERDDYFRLEWEIDLRYNEVEENCSWVDIAKNYSTSVHADRFPKPEVLHDIRRALASYLMEESPFRLLLVTGVLSLDSLIEKSDSHE